MNAKTEKDLKDNIEYLVNNTDDKELLTDELLKLFKEYIDN